MEWGKSRDCLQLILDLHSQEIKYEEWTQKRDKIFSSEGAEYHMYYYMDNMELTEHGGSVPGWLSEYGERMLSDLNEIINEFDK